MDTHENLNAALYYKAIGLIIQILFLVVPLIVSLSEIKSHGFKSVTDTFLGNFLFSFLLSLVFQIISLIVNATILNDVAKDSRRKIYRTMFWIFIAGLYPAWIIAMMAAFKDETLILVIFWTVCIYSLILALFYIIITYAELKEIRKILLSK